MTTPLGDTTMTMHSFSVYCFFVCNLYLEICCLGYHCISIYQVLSTV